MYIGLKDVQTQVDVQMHTHWSRGRGSGQHKTLLLAVQFISDAGTKMLVGIKCQRDVWLFILLGGSFIIIIIIPSKCTQPDANKGKVAPVLK
jgi:hypothetical protein